MSKLDSAVKTATYQECDESTVQIGLLVAYQECDESTAQTNCEKVCSFLCNNKIETPQE